MKASKKESRLTHYLSPGIQNEFIELCGKRVQKTILKEREDAIYYWIICDATPDVSHTEQNVVLIRYVPYNKNVDDWEITESEIAGMIESVLMDRGIDISDCRGQGYDNGANMLGKSKGVQAQILQKNNLATFSPCASHTYCGCACCRLKP